jgi:hypothetical protein
MEANTIYGIRFAPGQAKIYDSGVIQKIDFS